ncbi:glycosyltransferase family 4 protein [Corynebacterium casei]|uniref:glycosyltransferase family 4 protein n=1 Tax=Corynebacterium casei TaxID=160386 RepID=UPI003F97FBD8
MNKQIIRSSVETFFQVGLQFSHDPISTMNKIITKLDSVIPQKMVGYLGRHQRENVTSEARHLFDAGNLTEIVNARVTGPFQFIERSALHRSAEFQLRLLRMGIIESVENREPSGVKRPLYVLTSSLPYTQSGYTVRSHFILKALKSAGMDVRPVSRFGYPAVIGTISRANYAEIDGIRYFLNSHWYVPFNADKQIELAVKGLVQQARLHKATVLHTTTDFRNAIVVSRAAKELGIPWFYEVRGELEQTWLSRVHPDLTCAAQNSEYFLLSKAQEESARHSAAAVFVISEQLRGQFASEKLPESKIHVLPNAVQKIDFETPKLHGLVDSVPGLSGADSIIGTVSAVVEYEGLDILIHSLEHLPQGVHVLIVGDGSHRSDLEDLSKELGFQGRVHFVGKKPLDSIEDWYRLLDVFVLPRRDSELCRNITPIKAMQAQALGISVVASDLPALREVTGGFAEYVEPENPKSLATAVQKTIETSVQNSEKEQKLRGWLQTRTWDANAERLKQVWNSI